MPDDLVVYKSAVMLPVAVLGRDEQGRMLVTCPTCHEPAHVEKDGAIVCPLGQAQQEYLERALADALEQATDG